MSFLPKSLNTLLTSNFLTFRRFVSSAAGWALCLAWLALPSSGALAAGENDYLREAKASLAQGFYDQAIPSCEAALRLNPRDPLAFYYLAVAYSKKGDFAKPLHYYRRAVEKNPHDAFAYCELGLAWQLNGKPAEALACYHRAIALDPRCIAAYHGLAEIYGKSGGYKNDILYSRRALAIDPGDVDVYYVFRIPYVQKLVYEKARENFQRAIDIDPGFAMAYWTLGELYSKLAKIYSNEAHYDNAIKCWYRVIQLNPRESGAYFILGVTFREKGMTDRARVFLERAIRLKYYDIFGAYANLKDVYLQEGRERKFIRYLEKVLAKNPGDTEARYFLGESYLRNDRKGDARMQEQELRKYARHDLADRLKGFIHASP